MSSEGFPLNLLLVISSSALSKEGDGGRLSVEVEGWWSYATGVVWKGRERSMETYHAG